MYDVYIVNGSFQTQIHGCGYGLPSAKIEDAKNAISTFNFTIYPDNAGYELIEPFSTIVKVYNNNRNRYDFVGRALQITPCMDSDGMIYKTVVCEDRLGYLCDSIQPYTEEKQYSGDEDRTGLQEFIDVVLENHNAQVEDEKKIYRGNVTLQTYLTSDGVYKGLNYDSTWDVIKTKLLDVFGGELRLRETSGVLYLDYAEKLGTTRATKIELGRNMESAQRDVDCSGVVTRLIPLGVKLKETVIEDDGTSTEKETENRLTIASVNDGKIYVEDETAAGKYGRIYGTVIFDDVTDATNLKTKGLAYLEEHNVLTESNKVVALDLSLLGLDIDDFKLYDRYPCTNSLIGLSATLEIIKKTTDIIEPYSSSFEMGDVSVSMADSIINLSAAQKETATEIRRTVDTAIKSERGTTYTIVSTAVSSAIQQTEGNIMAKVEETTVAKSDYDSFSEIVRNILQMDANGTTMIFQTINEAIQDIGDTEASHYSEILKYIRFEDGNIILGESGNPLTLKIENDRIAFFQNGVAVAYFTNNRLYVTDGEFTNTFRLGKFQATPRANGNVTWKLVE